MLSLLGMFIAVWAIELGIMGGISSALAQLVFTSRLIIDREKDLRYSSNISSRLIANPRPKLLEFFGIKYFLSDHYIER